MADGIASGTIADYLGEKEDVEGGEKFDGFFKTICVGDDDDDAARPDTLYRIRGNITLKDVFIDATIEEIE